MTFDDVTQSVEMEEQMLQQERLASLGLLAAGVAHEINTPLTGISSYTQLLLDGEAGPAGREMLKKNRGPELSGRPASRVRCSAWPRPGEGEFQPLDLNDAVRDVLQLFAPQVRRSAVPATLRSRGLSLARRCGGTRASCNRPC